MKFLFSLLIFLLTQSINNPALFAKEKSDVFGLSLEELMGAKVITASRHEQDISEAPANITVITPEMIERRGYQNLVEILEDLPGFDFATYEDGGGEYPVHGLNRGIGGDPGNTKLLIMVDDIIQNHISFNWSMGWGNQQMLHDIEKIEIIQGPGSALYGSNAFSGIIHIITKKEQKKDNEIYLKPWVGQDGTRAVDLRYGGKKHDFHYSVALRKYNSDGDDGKNRPDPGNYFHNNVEPNILTQNYATNGAYQTNVANPTGGNPLRDGFNTSKDDIAARLNLFYINPGGSAALGTKEAGIGFSFWDKKDGLGSYVPGFEYLTADPDFLVHYQNYHIFGKHDFQITDWFNLKSSVWFRVNRQMPDTGFEYTYRFKNMAKTYHSYSTQAAIEEQALFSISEASNLLIGGRFMISEKMNQVISLNQEQGGRSSTTNSSWVTANSGQGLYQSTIANTINEDEFSLYGVFDSRYNEYVSYSLGARYDYSTEYGTTMNPRIGVTLKLPVKEWGASIDEWRMKLLYGTAFRQPSIFELYDEFRGSSDLTPEKIATYEIENNIKLFSNKNRDYFSDLDIKFNFFYSELKDAISLVSDPTKAGGESYVNSGKSWVRGFSTNVDLQAMENLTFYFNYIYTQDKQEGGSWKEIEHSSQHKFNAGFNWLTLYDHLNINFRVNHVGKRKVPATNSYFANHAPGYTKANLTLTGKNIGGKWLKRVKVEPQLIVKNIFDEDYYGVGRQAGSSDRTQWNANTNPNPPGFIPPYHPQPGRTWFFNVKVTY